MTGRFEKKRIRCFSTLVRLFLRGGLKDTNAALPLSTANDENRKMKRDSESANQQINIFQYQYIISIKFTQ